MSTKINVRSPFYLEIEEPSVPSVALTCDLVNLKGLQVDQQGIITLPTLDYGDIDSFTSTDSDFSDNKFATVSTATARTVSFKILIPQNFSNYETGAFITCDAQTTQPEVTCTGGVTTNGTIPNQTIAANGNSVTIDLSSYFTQGTDPISGYSIDNIFPNVIQSSISGSTLTLTSQNIGGTYTINVEATDSDPLTCDAVQPIQITVDSLPAFDCTTANLRGGEVAQDGTITDPLSTGEITAKSLTSGGAHITSVSANTGGSAQDVTLFFDITVPDGYTNAGDTFICSKTFEQQAPTTLPEFTCDIAGLTGQSIYQSGSILRGTTAEGSIDSFSPNGFDVVFTETPRTVTFQITPPASGYSNSGGANISCDVALTQPAAEAPTVGTNIWYRTGQNFTSKEDMELNGRVGGSKQNWKSFLVAVSLVSDTPSDWVNTPLGLVFGAGTSNVTYRLTNWGNTFIPIWKSKRTKQIQPSSFYVLEVRNEIIIGVWQYNNNSSSSGYQTLSKLY